MAESSPKKVQSHLRKGEIARDKQLLLLPQCFLKTCTADTQKHGLVWERVNAFPKGIYPEQRRKEK